MAQPFRRGRIVLLAALTLTAIVGAPLAGCTGGGDAVSITSHTPTPTMTATPTATAAAQSARSIDFQSAAIARPIIDHFKGGQIVPERITYADMTGDRVDDAVVVVESGGTAGDLGAAVFSVEQGQPKLLGYIDRAGKVEVRLAGPVAGVIVVTQGSYAPSDPQCCPSKLRELVFQWKDGKFEVITDQVIDNPQR